MLQDIEPQFLDNHYDASQKPGPDSRMILCRDRKLLLAIDREQRMLDFPLFSEIGSPEGSIFLFKVDQDTFFLTEPGVITDDDGIKARGFEWYTLREMMQWQPAPQAFVFAAFTAYQLAVWYDETRFCGKCGAQNVHDPGERAKICPVCGTKIYPRINPAVIVGVTNGDRLLLTKYNTGFAHHALVAGFTEIGETLEGTVAREVMEEAGIRVKHIRYYKSQPWGMASDILAGFYCDVDGDDTIRMDTSELKYAEWVPREEITLQPYNYSLTNEMMRMFKEGLQ